MGLVIFALTVPLAHWGNNRNGKKGKSGDGKTLLSYSGKTDLSSINSFYKEHYGGKYEGSIYFSGDFSKSVTYAKKLSKKYNLIFNNCMEVSCDVLRQGTFSKNNGSYRIFLSRVRSSIVPNVAYTRMLAFHSAVVLWQKSPWYLKVFLISPGSAALLL